MLYLVDNAGGDRGARAPRRQRRVALFPLKDVALFLPKEQGKETEAVNINIHIIKKETKVNKCLPRSRRASRPSPRRPAPPPAKGVRPPPAKVSGQ